MAEHIDESKEEKKDSEFVWNVYDFPKHKKTEDIKFEWGRGGIDKVSDRGILEEEIGEADRFFSFKIENEEFQKKLDAELTKMPLVGESVKEEAASRDESISEPESCQKDKLPKPEKESPAREEPKAAVIESPESTLWFENVTQTAKKKKGHCIKRCVLAVIVILLAAEAIVLGIKYFWPDSVAASRVTKGQIAIVTAIDSFRESVSEAFSGWDSGLPVDFDSDKTENKNDDAEDREESEPPKPVPDPNPASDKAALVESSLSYNKNIITVRSNEELSYEAGKDYGRSDVNNSVPLKHNILEDENDGSFLYIDKEIIATLIAFDSKWIDYVNGINRDVVDITKRDSRAYRNVTTFSKAGKVKQTFELLEIGELRKGENAYYAWTFEKIKEEIGGKTINKTYSWIYCLEPLDETFKIADYFRY